MRSLISLVLDLAKRREILGNKSVSKCWPAANMIVTRILPLIRDRFSRNMEVEDC